MGIAQIVATVLAGAVTIVAVVLAVRAVLTITAVIRQGKPDPARFADKPTRTKTMLVETLGHTRMLKWSAIGAAHWLVMVSFMILFLLVVEAYFEVVDPEGGLPIIGHWVVYGFVTEWIGILGLIGIVYLIVVRQRNIRQKRSRFLGSTMWQAYFVEAVILGVLACGFLIRGFKVANDTFEFPAWATPLSHGIGNLLPAAEDGPTWVALVKLFISMGWLITIALNPTMGVAWHRFLAFFNIFFKRAPEKPAGSGLGALRPMMSEGKPLDFEEADPEKDQFGVAQVEQFTWKGLLDFSTCTECGRCQSQCPAWNTAKPLSPKLLVLSLRDHAYAKAPYLLGGGGKDLTGEEKATEAQLAHMDVLALAEGNRPLIGTAEEQGVIDPDVLWSCTTCGACVEQCPVDIEHVDHIVDMRRYQVLIESSFPSEAGVMLRNLENKGNPWGAPQNTREDWTKGLDFEVPRVGEVEDFDYLFWVGCAGAFEDRAKKTTRAVAKLLHEAGVNYAILGEGETCTGDPARRIGNEFVFQMLAQQNVETLKEANVKRIVATCPHCFNTLGNEYEQLGLKVEVVHHTQLLQHLVSTGKLTPVQPIEGDVTYHDPCYLGRHNRVFDAPREVLGSATANLVEMPRNSERSFCCGAGGARMWMEEKIGKRINVERTEEALATGAKTIAVGCPFCYTMIGDGVTGKGEQENVEVVDVATVLLRSMKQEV
ncbi:heterodisulfide reductase-related iron-sulfur binding cluster [Actinoplanes sp. Pm04-4]|uniref:Heterodisulfide reductase-related iron-sulfur binding cluster n=1 Tax=Paractinoplanes pyxinae TaxID=2997416 RepID=A0ABT4BE77_9ACTN|nr:heterodisulfide reductase-related iron-sulfur binding cluster [Actinoplanes pyxinae]MCY1143893.1 heterodisulfide reductase-related iron-sulfur binding cluster [Actinoplanes pyxinae]